MFVRGIVERPEAEVVAICEPNKVRAAYYNSLLQELGAKPVPVYQPDAFLDMLQEEKVETIVITCIDALHERYIVLALDAGSEHHTLNAAQRDSRRYCSPRLDGEADDD